MSYSMKFLILATCVLALAVALPYNSQQQGEWQRFKSTNNKQYASKQEEELRMTIYFRNKETVQEHNALYDQGKVSFKLGMNKFADMMPGEVRARYNGFNKTTIHKDYKPDSIFKPTHRNLAESVDWRSSGAVTGVKDQGQCGSCWAFSATGSLEGQSFLRKFNRVSISEQNLVDCSGNQGNNGCGGGGMDNAFQYIKENNGIDTESSYPYEARDGECRFNRNNVGADDSGFVDVEHGSEEALKEAVAVVGPISVAIDASNYSFQLYESGIYDEPGCSSSSLDHGVLVVGYSSENGQDYWLVKNSWDTNWGEQGYIKMVRNKNNNCGIASAGSFPVV